MDGHNSDQRVYRGLREAFTLIELLVVMAILSIIMFIIAPRFVSFVNPEKTKNFIKGLQNALVYLNDKSVLQKQVYLFNFDLDEKLYYFTVSEDQNLSGQVRDRYLTPVSFPEALKVHKVRVIPGEEVQEGKIVVPFTPNGLLFSFEIVVEENEDSYLVLSGNSISNQIKLYKMKAEDHW